MAKATADVPAYTGALVQWAQDGGLLTTQNEQQLTRSLERVLSFAAEGKTHQAHQHLTQFEDAAGRVEDAVLRTDLLEAATELRRMLTDGEL